MKKELKTYSAEEVAGIKQLYFESGYSQVMVFLRNHYPDLYEAFYRGVGDKSYVAHWRAEKDDWLASQKIEKENYALLMRQINTAKLDLTTAIQEKLANIVYGSEQDAKELDQIVSALEKLNKIQQSLTGSTAITPNESKISIYSNQKQKVDILLTSALMEDATEDEDGVEPDNIDE